MSYRESQAPSSLADLVTGLWEFSVNTPDIRNYAHTVPPDGCVSLVLQYTEKARMLLLVGPRCSPLVVPVSSGERYFGIRFWPHASSLVLGEKLEKGRDYVGPTNFILPELTTKALAALPKQADQFDAIRCVFEQALAPLANSAQCELSKGAVNLIVQSGGAISVADIAKELGVSPRHLQRVFRAATGLTPKEFSRIRRFREAAAEVLTQNPRPWISVAYETGFADQPHMAREFTQLVGLSAEELREKQSHIDHIDVEP